jgi:hypothetical protein
MTEAGEQAYREMLEYLGKWRVGQHTEPEEAAGECKACIMHAAMMMCVQRGFQELDHIYDAIDDLVTDVAQQMCERVDRMACELN